MTTMATERAAIYTRVSSTQQEQDGTSLDTQAEQCRARATTDGATVSPEHVYQEVFTGIELWQRPKLTSLREAIRRREVDVVYAYAIDRLSRDPVHLGVLISEAEHAGVEIRFVSEPLDDSPEGQLIRFVRGYAAKVEHEKFKERSIRGRRARVAAGKPLVGPRPLYGYRWRDEAKSGLVPDDTTAPIVRGIFEAVMGGATLRTLAEDLHRRGVPTPSGRGTWRGSTLRIILRHLGYKGEAWGLQWKQKGPKRGSVTPREREGWVSLPEGTIPPIVDAATWDAVQAILTANQQRAVRNNRNPEAHLLRGGYAICGSCGGTMTVCFSGPADSPGYRCRRSMQGRHLCPRPVHIGGKKLDTAVWKIVAELLAHPELIERQIKRMLENDPTRADLATVDRQLADLGRRQGNLIASLEHLTPDAAAPVRERLTALVDQQRALEAERQALAGRRQGWEAALQQLRDLEDWCEKVAQRTAGGLSYAQRRAALEAFKVKVTVYAADTGPEPYTVTTDLPIQVPIADTTTSAYGDGMTSPVVWSREVAAYAIRAPRRQTAAIAARQAGSVVGSPSTRSRSAVRPGAIVPVWPATPSSSAAAPVAAWRAANGVRPPSATRRCTSRRSDSTGTIAKESVPVAMRTPARCAVRTAATAASQRSRARRAVSSGVPGAQFGACACSIATIVGTSQVPRRAISSIVAASSR
jgi:site-specific DNA recombinase